MNDLNVYKGMELWWNLMLNERKDSVKQVQSV